MTDQDSQRTKRMPQFYFQELADETSSRLQFVDLLFKDHDGEKRENGTNGREEGVRKKGDRRFLFSPIRPIFSRYFFRNR
jgi:hypothetical protein